MVDLRIADGLYLVHKNIGIAVPTIRTEVATDHIVVIDCSGSMYNELPQIRQQLKNKLPMMMRPDDTVTLIWFSGRNQYGVVVEAVAMRTALDLTGVHRAIDSFLKPIALTGFVQPLEEVAKVIGRVQKPGRAINLFFMSDGHDNQWRQDEILKAVDALQAIVSSAAVVEYGFYCNRPLMVKMSERLGASEILAENFVQYEPIFETAMTKKTIGSKKIEVHLYTNPLHGFAFTVGDGEILSFAPDEKNIILVPDGTTDVYWLSETPSGTVQITPEICDGRVLTVVEEGLPTALYASLVPLTQRMLSNDIFRVLKATGDVRLVRQFANCFGKQAYTGFQSSATECVFTPKHRLLDGYDPNEVPPEDAYTVLDLLYLLASDNANLFYPSHESFSYERIGRRAVEVDQVLTDDESARVGEIAAALSSTRDPSHVKRLQEELSALVEHKKPLKFVADDPDAGYPVSALVLNEDRPNVSAHVEIPGTIDLTDVMDTRSWDRHGATCDYYIRETNHVFPVKFPTTIHRNYTIVRDGIRNVQILPVSLTEPSFKMMIDEGVLAAGTVYQPGMIYEIDLTKLPLINRKMVKSVSAKTLFEKQYSLLRAKAAQKVFNYYFDQNFPSAASKGFVEKYGVDGASWLSGLGIKDYGYSPKVELAEITESYYGKELTVSISGLSSLPTVQSVVDKTEAGKKLTVRETLLATAVKEVKDFLASATYTSVEADARVGILRSWLTGRKYDMVSLSRRLMREVSEIKFSVIVGQVWPVEWSSLDENSLTMDFDGHSVECRANLREIEVKV